MPNTQAQIIAHRLWRVQQRGLAQFLAQHAPPNFQHGGKLGISRQAHALVFAQLGGGSVHHAAQAAVGIQQRARQIHRTHALRAHTQQNRQQFGIA